MRKLNMPETKLKIIEKLIILNDDKVFEKIEKIIDESLQRPKAKKYTKQELIKRAQLSNKNIESKEVISQDEVEKLAQNW